MPDPDLEIDLGGGEGGRSFRPLNNGGTVSKNFFWALRTSVWSKNNGRGSPPPPGSATGLYQIYHYQRLDYQRWQRPFTKGKRAARRARINTGSVEKVAYNKTPEDHLSFI